MWHTLYEISRSKNHQCLFEAWTLRGQSTQMSPQSKLWRGQSLPVPSMIYATANVKKRGVDGAHFRQDLQLHKTWQMGELTMQQLHIYTAHFDFTTAYCATDMTCCCGWWGLETTYTLQKCCCGLWMSQDDVNVLVLAVNRARANVVYPESLLWDTTKILKV